MQKNAEYVDKLTRIMEKAQQLDSMLSEITRDLLEAKDSSPPESGRYINSAISSLGVMHRSLSTVKYEINNAAQPPRPKGSQGRQNFRPRNEAVQQGPTELDIMVQALVNRGYNRSMKAEANQIWYAHPVGHQISAAPNGGTFQWTYFPPRLLGEVSKGIGFEKLNTQLDQAHRHDPPPVFQQNEEAEKVRDYLVQQVEEKPIEQYRVWEKGEEYPSIVTYLPQSGTWRCFTCSGNHIESAHDPDIHTEAVKRWVRSGKPAPPDQAHHGGYERPGFHSTNSPIGLMDLNPTRKKP